MPAAAFEANFDGLVGPTHHYAGLASGNRASARNAAQVSNPRAAALQGLAKMRALLDLGLDQGVLPPQERPDFAALRAHGYRGREAEVLRVVQRDEPQRLLEVSSASSMWAANAATVSPSADCADARVHFTPANLSSHAHRALEAPTTARLLQTLFADAKHFAHHPPLAAELADEGAANHLRLCAQHGEAGAELFVYGREAVQENDSPALHGRQLRAASDAIARAHGLSPARTAFLRQGAQAIASGVFHNDVVALSHRQLLLHHELAFEAPEAIDATLARLLGPATRVQRVVVRESQLRLQDAVDSYLFNSQLVDHPQGGMWLLCAQECAEDARSWRLVQEWIADPALPIRGAQVFDLRQSMRNGGGPACLRLRVVLTPAQRAAVHAQAWLTPALHAQLEDWVRQHYRDRLLPADLADPQLLDETRTALDRLTRLLGLGSFYAFQR